MPAFLKKPKSTASHKKTRRIISKRILALSLLLLLLLGLGTAAYLVPDQFGLTFVQRHLTKDTSTQQSVRFSHGSRSSNGFIPLGEGLLAISQTRLQVFSMQGEVMLTQQVNMDTPAYISDGTTAVVYDIGGQDFYVLTEQEMIFHNSLPDGQYILSLTVNPSGYVTVTSKIEGYKGVVTVYTPKYEPLVCVRISSNYISSAMLTPDGKHLCILAPSQRAGIFDTTVLYYDVSEAESPLSQTSIGSNVLLQTVTAHNRIWMLGDQSLCFLNNAGELVTEYSYAGRYLKRASVEGKQFATLLLADSLSGSNSTLVTVDTEGVELGTLPITEQVIALRAYGRYVGVLTPTKFYLYTKNLKEVHVTEEIQNVQNFVLYASGDVSFIGDTQAWLYLP